MTSEQQEIYNQMKNSIAFDLNFYKEELLSSACEHEIAFCQEEIERLERYTPELMIEAVKMTVREAA